ncbi:MAG: hypothetical protein M1434_00290 [Chloroflexi bacterium]|nr:hypothetical protein [Chloroflexota bacterium]MCL5273173.1 hypothetical protein [Chloroflexota bacterium]
MNNTQANRNGAKPKSIVLKNGAQPRVYRTFEDWQAVQERDSRTPEERGIKVGSAVMWRHRNGSIISTDRATVIAIAESTLTIQVKDVELRTCDVNIHEIVNTEDDRQALRETNRRLYQGNRAGPSS